MIWLCVVAFGVTALAAAFIVRWARDHARVYGQGMPQRFHVGHVPRLGGLRCCWASVSAGSWAMCCGDGGTPVCCSWARGCWRGC